MLQGLENLAVSVSALVHGKVVSILQLAVQISGIETDSPWLLVTPSVIIAPTLGLRGPMTLKK